DRADSCAVRRASTVWPLDTYCLALSICCCRLSATDAPSGSSDGLRIRVPLDNCSCVWLTLLWFSRIAAVPCENVCEVEMRIPMPASLTTHSELNQTVRTTPESPVPMP